MASDGGKEPEEGLAAGEAAGDWEQATARSLDFLLADFNATKAEIGRRSNLQRAALATYGVVLAFTFRELASGSLQLPAIVAMWVVAATVLLYYRREALEISRLAWIIRTRIAPQAAAWTGAAKAELLPSEMRSSHPEIDEVTRVLETAFQWLVFVGIPAAPTVLNASRAWEDLKAQWSEQSSIYGYLAVGVPAILGIFSLLRLEVSESS